MKELNQSATTEITEKSILENIFAKKTPQEELKELMQNFFNSVNANSRENYYYFFGQPSYAPVVNEAPAIDNKLSTAN